MSQYATPMTVFEAGLLHLNLSTSQEDGGAAYLPQSPLGTGTVVAALSSHQGTLLHFVSLSHCVYREPMMTERKDKVFANTPKTAKDGATNSKTKKTSPIASPSATSIALRNSNQQQQQRKQNAPSSSSVTQTSKSDTTQQQQQNETASLSAAQNKQAKEEERERKEQVKAFIREKERELAAYYFTRQTRKLMASKKDVDLFKTTRGVYIHVQKAARVFMKINEEDLLVSHFSGVSTSSPPASGASFGAVQSGDFSSENLNNNNNNNVASLVFNPSNIQFTAATPNFIDLDLVFSRCDPGQEESLPVFGFCPAKIVKVVLNKHHVLLVENNKNNNNRDLIRYPEVQTYLQKQKNKKDKEKNKNANKPSSKRQDDAAAGDNNQQQQQRQDDDVSSEQEEPLPDHLFRFPTSSPIIRKIEVEPCRWFASSLKLILLPPANKLVSAHQQMSSFSSFGNNPIAFGTATTKAENASVSSPNKESTEKDASKEQAGGGDKKPANQKRGGNATLRGGGAGGGQQQQNSSTTKDASNLLGNDATGKDHLQQQGVMMIVKKIAEVDIVDGGLYSDEQLLEHWILKHAVRLPDGDFKVISTTTISNAKTNNNNSSTITNNKRHSIPLTEALIVNDFANQTALTETLREPLILTAAQLSQQNHQQGLSASPANNNRNNNNNNQSSPATTTKQNNQNQNQHQTNWAPANQITKKKVAEFIGAVDVYIASLSGGGIFSFVGGRSTTNEVSLMGKSTTSAPGTANETTGSTTTTTTTTTNIYDGLNVLSTITSRHSNNHHNLHSSSATSFEGLGGKPPKRRLCDSIALLQQPSRRVEFVNMFLDRFVVDEVLNARKIIRGEKLLHQNQFRSQNSFGTFGGTTTATFNGFGDEDPFLATLTMNRTLHNNNTVSGITNNINNNVFTDLSTLVLNTTTAQKHQFVIDLKGLQDREGLALASQEANVSLFDVISLTQHFTEFGMPIHSQMMFGSKEGHHGHHHVHNKHKNDSSATNNSNNIASNARQTSKASVSNAKTQKKDELQQQQQQKESPETALNQQLAKESLKNQQTQFVFENNVNGMLEDVATMNEKQFCHCFDPAEKIMIPSPSTKTNHNNSTSSSSQPGLVSSAASHTQQKQQGSHSRKEQHSLFGKAFNATVNAGQGKNHQRRGSTVAAVGLNNTTNRSLGGITQQRNVAMNRASTPSGKNDNNEQTNSADVSAQQTSRHKGNGDDRNTNYKLDVKTASTAAKQMASFIIHIAERIHACRCAVAARRFALQGQNLISGLVTTTTGANAAAATNNLYSTINNPHLFSHNNIQATGLNLTQTLLGATFNAAQQSLMLNATMMNNNSNGEATLTNNHHNNNNANSLSNFVSTFSTTMLLGGVPTTPPSSNDFATTTTTNKLFSSNANTTQNNNNNHPSREEEEELGPRSNPGDRSEFTLTVGCGSILAKLKFQVREKPLSLRTVQAQLARELHLARKKFHDDQQQTQQQSNSSNQTNQQQQTAAAAAAAAANLAANASIKFSHSEQQTLNEIQTLLSLLASGEPEQRDKDSHWAGSIMIEDLVSISLYSHDHHFVSEKDDDGYFGGVFVGDQDEDDEQQKQQQQKKRCGCYEARMVEALLDLPTRPGSWSLTVDYHTPVVIEESLDAFLSGSAKKDLQNVSPASHPTNVHTRDANLSDILHQDLQEKIDICLEAEKLKLKKMEVDTEEAEKKKAQRQGRRASATSGNSAISFLLNNAFNTQNNINNTNNNALDDAPSPLLPKSSSQGSFSDSDGKQLVSPRSNGEENLNSTANNTTLSSTTFQQAIKLTDPKEALRHRQELKQLHSLVGFHFKFEDWNFATRRRRRKMKKFIAKRQQQDADGGDGENNNNNNNNNHHHEAGAVASNSNNNDKQLNNKISYSSPMFEAFLARTSSDDDDDDEFEKDPDEEREEEEIFLYGAKREKVSITRRQKRKAAPKRRRSVTILNDGDGPSSLQIVDEAVPKQTKAEEHAAAIEERVNQFVQAQHDALLDIARFGGVNGLLRYQLNADEIVQQETFVELPQRIASDASKLYQKLAKIRQQKKLRKSASSASSSTAARKTHHMSSAADHDAATAVANEKTDQHALDQEGKPWKPTSSFLVAPPRRKKREETNTSKRKASSSPRTKKDPLQEEEEEVLATFYKKEKLSAAGSIAYEYQFSWDC